MYIFISLSSYYMLGVLTYLRFQSKFYENISFAKDPLFEEMFIFFDIVEIEGGRGTVTKKLFQMGKKE